jgi:plasmid stabilization system protein ParE
MSKQVVWSPSAENDFAQILEYLDSHWNEKVANQFIDITEQSLEQISINPKHFPLIHKGFKIRKFVLTKHNTVFYREGKTAVEIIRIFDTRQDPDSLTF